jgi:hypothetical protein
MSRKLLSLVTGLVLTLGAGSAMAGGPMALTGNQMDHVTAGGIALSLGAALATATGGVAAFTATTATTATVTTPVSAAAGSLTTSVSASAG